VLIRQHQREDLGRDRTGLDFSRSRNGLRLANRENARVDAKRFSDRLANLRCDAMVDAVCAFLSWGEEHFWTDYEHPQRHPDTLAREVEMTDE
jgi:hypothetical protein